MARPWALPRASNPAGGISSNAGDLIRWARFHLGDGRAADGTRVLPDQLLRSMQQPTAQSPGNAVGDAVGISWWLKDVGGVRVVAHGGNTLGQDSAFDMVPERDFAVLSLANCSPNGSQFNERVRRWAFETCLGVTERDPEPVTLSAADLVPYTGHYETIASTVEISAADGSLTAAIEVKPEVRAELTEDDQTDPDLPPFSMGLLEGTGDRYIITDGPAKGMKGYFARSGTGEITGVHLGGRLASKTGPARSGPR